MFVLPAPPPDGGFLVLNDAQLGNLDLLCLIKTHYPRTRIYAQRALPAAVRRVMSIGNAASQGPTGIAGYMARRDPAVLGARAMRDAMDKIKAGVR